MRWLLFSLLLVTHPAEAQPTLRLDTAFESSLLVGYLARLDTARAVPPAQLPALGLPFRYVPETLVSYGADTRHHYLRVRLQNTTATSLRLVLNLQQFFYDTAAVYAYTPTGTLLSSQLSGWQVPVLHRPLPYPLHSFPIDVPAGQVRWLVVHTKVNPQQRVSKALLQLYTEPAFGVAVMYDLLEQGILYGCLLLAIGLGLVLRGYTNRRLYGIYSLYVLAQLAYVLNVNGLYDFLPLPDWCAAPLFGYLAVIASVALQGHFYLRFLGVSQSVPRWLRWFAEATVWAMTGLLVVVALIPQHPAIRPVSNVLTGTYLLGMFACIGLGVWQRRSGAGWMLAAVAPVLLLVAYYLLSGWGVLPLYLPMFTMQVVSPVLMIEVLALGVGLVYRFNADRKTAILRLSEVERDTARRIMQAQDEERQQLAANLHDDLGGTLATLKGELTRPTEQIPGTTAPTAAIELTERAVQDLRLISHHLMPTAFAQKGLRQVLEEAVDLTNRAQTRTSVVLVCHGTERRLPPEREINTYRILRELLTNALKHAEATRITVQLIYYDMFLYASVEDDGHGINPTASEHGIGLRNIQLRADYLHAPLTTESGPLGTLVALEVPYG